MVNKAILVGRLGKEPERRTAQSGKVVCRFSLATDTGFGDNRTTDWHNIVCFDKQADFCGNYLHRGSLVYIEGRISTRQYEKDGAKQYITEIIASTVQSLGGRNESQGAAGSFDANAYDSPAYGGNSGYNGGSNYGGGNYNNGGSNYNNNRSYGGNAGNPAPAAPSQPDSFDGGDVISDDSIPF
ncbi:MAG: single-stranded DNA-binding protein [Proteobacteria bacterium]|nr:single-stranded DNA-binding protein [Pseudomonadota bacterium]